MKTPRKTPGKNFPKAPATLAARLRTTPHRFDGLQAVRVAELGAPGGMGRLGTDVAPGDEGLRLVAMQGLAFAPAEAVSLTYGQAGRARSDGLDGDGAARATLRIAFLGLTGPLGVLPQIYAEMVQRADRMRNTSVSAFLDMFNHRLASLLVRAGEKYRLGLLVQRAATQAGAAPNADPASAAMLAIAGFGTPQLRGRLSVPDEVLLYYAGLFAGRNRPAGALAAMLADYVGLPVRVEQFSGRWVDVAPEEQTCLTQPGMPPRFAALGIDTVAGNRIWDVAGNFRVVVGPVGRASMRDLMPDAPGLRRLVDLVRAFAGPDLGFDVQVILKRDEVPDLALNPSGDPDAPRLGWNTWAKSLPALADKEDIVLDPELVMRAGAKRDEMEMTPTCA